METIEAETPTNTFVWVKSYDDVMAYPLSDSLGYLTLLVAAYLAFVIKIGPAYMKNREPFQLKKTILFYNAVQVLLSFLFAFLLLRPLILAGLFPKTTKNAHENPEIRGMMAIGIYSYFLGKITELLDTIFFVLRKKDKQVTFLHVYHHSSVVIGTWMMCFYTLNQTGVYSFFINSIVHVVMYSYYFLAAWAPEYAKYLTWKKHITTFQLVQFVSMFLHQAFSLYFTSGEHYIMGAIYVFGSSAFFFMLFSNFYMKSYKKSKLKQNGHQNGHQNGYQNGHQNGFQNGHQNGYQNGHQNGVATHSEEKIKEQ